MLFCRSHESDSSRSDETPELSGLRRVERIRERDQRDLSRRAIHSYTYYATLASPGPAVWVSRRRRARLPSAPRPRAARAGVGRGRRPGRRRVGSSFHIVATPHDRSLSRPPTDPGLTRRFAGYDERPTAVLCPVRDQCVRRGLRITNSASFHSGQCTCQRRHRGSPTHLSVSGGTDTVSRLYLLSVCDLSGRSIFCSRRENGSGGDGVGGSREKRSLFRRRVFAGRR